MGPTVGGLRDVGGIRAVQELFSGPLVDLFAAATHLGDPPLLAVLALLAYWVGPAVGALDRRDAGRLLAVVVLGLALTTALKFGFALSRPPPSVRAVPADGFGFPSGHAIGTTVAAGAAAAFCRVGRRRTRRVLAGGLVALVATSRVVIGVHYPVDVVAGVAAGLLVLAAGVPLARRRTGGALALAAAVGLVAGVLAWPTVDGAVALGAPAGLAAGWWLAGRQRGQCPDERPAERRAHGSGGAGTVVGGAVVLGVGAVATAAAGSDPVALALLAATAGLLAGAVPGLGAVGALLPVDGAGTDDAGPEG